MQKRYRDLLRNIITGLRNILNGSANYANGGGDGQRGDLDRELERLGIEPDGTVAPFDALPNPSPIERRARRVAEAQLVAAPAAQRAATRTEIVERAAYTWINRLLALRATEARGLINEILRSDRAYDGLSEALFILRQTQPQRAAGPDGGWWAVIEDACREQAVSLPGLFDLADPSAALRPSVPALLRCVALISTTPVGYTAQEADATFADPDAIGWAYQFYQEEAKARTYAKLNSGGKAATRAEIAAITQLFTEPYMVKWLLQNSLGRTYHELYPDSKLPETWEYYIRESAKQHISDDSPIRSLADLTFMDPCSGSGHIEREAFDMFAAMYREQYPDMSATEIADLILTRHLHGIDLDPRAAQLTALTLYLRAWELVRDERRARRLPGPGSYRPPAMNLATTPTGLTPGSLERHLQRHPEDRMYRPLLEGIFAALEQADVLGSLLRPGEQLDAALRAFRTQGSGQLGLLAEDDDLNRLLGELARHDPAQLKRMLLERIARSFAAEASDADDVAMALFGREAGEGIRLLQLLDRQYAVVATNPPYMGSGNMGIALKDFVEVQFRSARSDLYAAFIIRCVQLCARCGRAALITRQSWMFLRSFSELRAVSEEHISKAHQESIWKGLLRDTAIECLAQLGPYAFEEISGEVVQVCMFALQNVAPKRTHHISALRLSGFTTPGEKDSGLRKWALSDDCLPSYSANQGRLLTLAESPILYWLTEGMWRLFDSGARLQNCAEAVEGVQTGENLRWVRFFWEVALGGKDREWVWYLKGGGYRKWVGLDDSVVRWRGSGGPLGRFPKATLRNSHRYFQQGLSYTDFAGGSLGVRFMKGDEVFDLGAPAVFLIDNSSWSLETLSCVLNSRVASFLVRLLSPNPQHIRTGYLRLLPLPSEPPTHEAERLVMLSRDCREYLEQSSHVSRRYNTAMPSASSESRRRLVETVLATSDGACETRAATSYALDESDTAMVSSELGVPAGWHSLVAGYEALPAWPTDLGPSPCPRELLNRLAAIKHIRPDATELAHIRANLRTLYEAGSGAKADGLDLEDLEHNGDEDQAVSGAYIPIPAESFVEELSQKLHIHPISVYWLLEELRAEGARCKPEELRLLEDRLSVLVLRLLGHRWPRQIEAEEPVSDWADADGIIPLIPISGEVPLAERVRNRLRAEDGDRGAQQVEALLQELIGQTLEEWLRRTFFARHVRQFKHRPIAWHLASTPTKDGGRRTKVKREPAFQCLLYYHACRGDVLARLRAQYVEPLIRLETAATADARRRSDETAAAIAVSCVHELEDFATRLRDVEETGFVCAELDRLLAGEPLDRWNGDGIVPPSSADELAAQERAWRVDINDGVRVNVAPLQLAGLLTGDVLRPDDARKAIADRARWRSDERRWVREGVLPRCGWMDDDVPESPRWTERAPEREAEQRKLEEKRRAVVERLGDPGKESS